MNETTVQWIDELTFTAQTGSGHQIILDGGREAGASPMEMLLVGMAGCTAIDVVHILQRQRQPLTGLTVRVQGERAEDHPKVYTHISVEYVARGALDAAKVQRAIELSEEKYCSASAMLGVVARIESRFRIEPD
ncbi:MAG: OsmC family protein [Caldilineales bacterium]|nr:OsmC family protein [Caldilineales bacterium]